MDISLENINPSAAPQISFAQYDGKEIDAFVQGDSTIINGVYADLNGKEVAMQFDETQGIYTLSNDDLSNDSITYDPNDTNSVEIKYSDVNGNQQTVTKPILNLPTSPVNVVPIDLSKINNSTTSDVSHFSNINSNNAVQSELERPFKIEATDTDKLNYLNKTMDDEDSKGHTYEFQVYLKADKDTDAAIRVRNKDKTDDSGSVLKVLSNPNDPNSELVDGQVTTNWQKFTTGPIDFTHDNTGGYVRTTIYPAGNSTGATGTVYAYGAVLLKDGVPVKAYDPNLESGPGLDYKTTGPSTTTAMPEFAPGTDPSVAINNKGQAVAVSTDTNNKLLIYTGQKQDDGSITWNSDSKGNPKVQTTLSSGTKDNGNSWTGAKTPDVSISNNGKVAIAFETVSPKNNILEYDGTFSSTGGVQWANGYGYGDVISTSGHNPSVATNGSNDITAYNGNKNPDEVYYTARVFGGSNYINTKVKYSSGQEPAIAIEDDNTVLEAHAGADKYEGNVYYDLGKLGADGKIAWTDTNDSGTAFGRFIGSAHKGYAPTVSITNNGDVLAAYSAKDPATTTGNSDLHYVVGQVSGGEINWTDDKIFGSGRNPGVAMNDNLQFITTDNEKNNEIYLGSGSLQMTSATANFNDWHLNGVSIDNNTTDALSIDGSVVYNLTAHGVYGDTGIVNKQTTGDTNGRTATFSVYLRSDTDQPVELNIKDNQNLQSIEQPKIQTVGPDWKKYSVTLTFTDDGPTGIDYYFYPAGVGTNVAGSVQAYGATLTYTDQNNNN